MILNNVTKKIRWTTTTSINFSHLLPVPGSKLVASHSMHETSSVMVDPVTRAISCSQQAAPTQSDASKVVAKGLGLTKGFIGQKNSFSVDCSKAGVCDCDCDQGIYNV